MEKVNLIISDIKNLHNKDIPNIFLTSSFSQFKKGYKYLNNKDEIEISDPNHENFANFDLIYNELLEITSKKLNENLKLNKTLRAWEIILGSWLYQTTHVLFFYYNKIKILNYKKFKYSSFVDNSKKEDIFLYYQKNFNKKNPFKDSVFLYKFLSIFLENINEIEKNYNNIDFIETSYFDQTNKDFSLKVILFKLINKFNSFFFKDSKNLIFINKEFVGLKFILKIFFKSNLKKIFLNWNTFTYENFNYDYKLRSKITNQHYNSSIDFINFVSKFIFFLIPYEYIENYKNNELLSSKIFGNKNYEKIITSVEIFKIPFFSIWLSNQINKNAKLFIYQHGGTYGTTKFNFYEKIEIKISDFYLSWGWKNDDKIIKFFYLKEFKKSKKQNSNSITLIFQNFPLHYTQPHTNFLYGYKTFGQIDRLQKLFLKLKTITSYKFESRFQNIYEDDTTYELNTKFRNSIDFKLSNKKHNIFDIFKNSVLTIHTYEGTPFLEALIFNKPTLLFFDPKITPIRNEAKFYFDKLKERQVYHISSESLFNFLIKFNTPENLYSWWYSKQTQEAVSLFRKEFCNVSKNIKSDFSLIL